MNGTTMSIEYHGWVALATSCQDWSDGDFEESFARVRDAIQALAPEQGHDPVMPRSELLPQMLYFSGYEADSIAPVLDVIREIAAVFDRAYGELVACNQPASSVGWDFSFVTRYRLVGGQLTRE